MLSLPVTQTENLTYTKTNSTLAQFWSLVTRNYPKMLCKKNVLKNFPEFTGNICTGISF